MIFFVSDIGSQFVQIPQLFPKSLDYVLTNGLLNTSNSSYYIDTNAIECLKNLSCECLDLFDSEMIYKTLNVCEAVLVNMPAIYADKLIESVMNILTKLPENEVFKAQQKVLLFILTELQAASPLGLQPRPQAFHKGIVLMSAAFGAMTESTSKDV